MAALAGRACGDRWACRPVGGPESSTRRVVGRRMGVTVGRRARRAVVG